MWIIVARREFQHIWRDGRFQMVALVLGILLATSLIVGGHYQRELNLQVESAAQDERERWISQGEKNPHSAAHYGIWVFRPRLAPAFLDPGIEPYVGVTTWLEAHRQGDFRFRPADDATAVQRFGDLTLALVLKSLLPLMIILTGFGAVVSEREQGTLRQIFATRIAPLSYLCGKAAGLAAVILVVAFPAWLLAVLVYALVFPQHSGTDAFLRLALVGGAYATYLATFVLITVGVSALAPSSRAALILLLSFWAVQALLIPRTGAEVAARMYPLPSATTTGAQMHDHVNDFWHDEQLQTRYKTEVLTELMPRFDAARPEDVRVNQSGLMLVASERVTDQLSDRVYGALAGRIERQNVLRNRLGWLSPFAAIDALSMALAGTDFTHHHHFARAAERYRRVIQKVLNEEIMLRGPPDLADSEVYRVFLADRELWERIPPFEYRSAPLGDVLRAQLGALAALGVWLLAACALLVLSARRLRPV
jgi:ABC-2 type transport system permease protein